jgi:hypothetical protein
MRVITAEQLPSVLATLPANPRIIASGNFATPHTLLKAADGNLEKFVLHMLNAHPGIPDREGITYESAFVGPAMRRHPRLDYIPSRLSLLPVVIESARAHGGIVIAQANKQMPYTYGDAQIYESEID